MTRPFPLALRIAAAVTAVPAIMGGACGGWMYHGATRASSLPRDPTSVLTEGILPGLLIGGGGGLVFSAAVLAVGAALWALGPEGPGTKRDRR